MTKKEVIVPADDLVCLGKDKLQELIRCKDCKRNKSDKWVDCPITEMYGRTTDNYCSLGERKEQ